MKKIFLIIMVSLSSLLSAQDIVYRESSSFAQDEFAPIRHYLNASYDVGQNPYFFYQHDFWDNHRLVFDKIKSPHRSIKNDGGYGELFSKEFFGSNALPNYSLHLLGGGYDYRNLYYWYKSRGYAFPHTLAIITSYAGHFGNEAYEASNDKISSHDHIADLYFFDIIGKVLMMNDEFAHFVIDDLGLSAWHFQPLYATNDKEIINAGLNYIARPKALSFHQVTPLLYMGMQVLGGASYQFKPDHYLSAALGVAVTEPFEKRWFYSGLLAYDIAGEPRAILNINGTEAKRARLLIYPKVFSFYPKYQLGITSFVEREGGFGGGVQLNLPLGLAGVWR